MLNSRSGPTGIAPMDAISPITAISWRIPSFSLEVTPGRSPFCVPHHDEKSGRHIIEIEFGSQGLQVFAPAEELRESLSLASMITGLFG
jgi:hypothetical protein